MRSRADGLRFGFVAAGVAALALALALAGCVPTAGPAADSGPGAGSTIASTVASDQLRARLSGASLRGSNAAGEAFCADYDPDGTLTMVIPGHPAETGRWTVGDGQVCETLRGLTACSRFDFQPPAHESASITSPDGAFLPYTAAVTRSDTCGDGP